MTRFLAVIDRIIDVHNNVRAAVRLGWSDFVSLEDRYHQQRWTLRRANIAALDCLGLYGDEPAAAIRTLANERDMARAQLDVARKDIDRLLAVVKVHA